MVTDFSNIHIVLVRPLYPRNIGQCSRAMSNMGCDQLHIVAPQCEINLEAREGAARGQGPLEKAQHYTSIEEFYQSNINGVFIAFSRRPGKRRPIDSWLTQATNRTTASRPQFLLFGPEDCGLSDQDLELAHQICDLPVFGPHGSLNLSHAVLLALYILQQQNSEKEEPASDDSLKGDRGYAHPIKPHRPEYFPSQSIKNWILALGFDISDRKISAYSVIKRILLKNEPNPREIRTMEAVLEQTVRKLKEKSKN